MSTIVNNNMDTFHSSTSCIILFDVNKSSFKIRHTLIVLSSFSASSFFDLKHDHGGRRDVVVSQGV